MIVGLLAFVGALLGVGLWRRGHVALGVACAVASVVAAAVLAALSDPRPLTAAVAVVLIDFGSRADRRGHRALPLAILSAGILCLIATPVLPG